MSEPGRILVLYGSQTFTSQETAERIWWMIKSLGFRGPVQPMDDYPISKLIHEEFAIFVCSTTGQGEEPDNMKKFWKFLLRKSLPSKSLVKLKFGVLGLGDSSYSKFNFTGKKLHKRLLQLGATSLLDIGLCDYQHDLGHNAVMVPWLKDFFSKLKNYFPSIQTNNLTNNFIPRWKVTLIKGDNVAKDKMTQDIYYSNGCKDGFLDTVLFETDENVRITDESHFQDVRLISFRTTGDAVLKYKPGDVFNIRPRNSKEDVEDLFGIFQMHSIDIKPHYRLLVEECYEGKDQSLLLWL